MKISLYGKEALIDQAPQGAKETSAGKPVCSFLTPPLGLVG